jgi:hypothetical protein
MTPYKSTPAAPFLFVLLVVSVFTGNAQVRINEICAANGDIKYDPDFYNYSSWVELYNEGDVPIDIGGWHITDKPENPTLWTIPPNTVISAYGYIILWCDQENTSLHTNFSLDSDGEQLILRNVEGETVDDVLFPKHPVPNISYGRIGSGHFELLNHPTPASDNDESIGTSPLENPNVSMAAGRYSGPVSIAITHSTGTATIRYTMDGSEPNEDSDAYTGPIPIGATSTLKVKAFADGWLPSKSVVETYFINEHEFNMKVISVSVNPKYLYDEKTGIYVIGTNGVPGRGSDTPVNWNQSWWRHADIEFFERSGAKIFDKSVDIQISGNYSRQKPQKSFEVKARDKYGKSFFEQRLFPHKNIEKVKGFLLRNSGTEWSVTHFRDDLTQYSTFGQMDIDFQDSEPYAIYLNGEYWGILNLREKIGENYIESNYNLSAGQFDIMEKNGRVISGSNEKYDAFMDSLRKEVNLENPETITFLERNVDVQEFINYYVTNIYYSCTDWPHNNIKYWNPKNGKIRYLLYDMDYSMNHGTTTSTPTYPSLNVVTDPQHPKGEWSTRHIRNALRNPIFRKRFISTMSTSLQTTFATARLNGLISKFRDRYEDEMVHHMERWDGSMDRWNLRVQQMRDFVNQRNDFLKQHMEEFFRLQDQQVALSVTVLPEAGGKYELNGITHSDNLEDAFYYHGLPVNFKAIPRPGYRFKNITIRRRGHEKVDVISKGSEWNYLDTNTEPVNNWTSMDYDDSEWSSGLAQLGYGDNDEKTKISFGPNSSDKHIATYFRKEFDIDTERIAEVSASVQFDDGVVVYLNGAEIFRHNMPEGNIQNTTLAIDGAENLWMLFVVDKTLLINGKNILAVSVHQNSVSSSDLSFDFELRQIQLQNIEEITSVSRSISEVAYSDVEINVNFEQINGVVINEFSASNSTLKDASGDAEDWIELYNGGTNATDVAGLYITDDLASRRKFKIPAGSAETTIHPGEYLLLWADGELSQGKTHVNFKLSEDGEALALSIEENGTLLPLDEVHFGAQQENQSFARMPNGTGPFALTDFTTPGKENNFPVDVESGRNEWFDAFPNPTNGIIILTFQTPMDAVEVYDLYGRLVKNAGPMAQEGEIDMSEPPAGVYIIKAMSGRKQSFKRIVKR